MRSRRGNESDESSLDSLLSWADEDEKQQIARLLEELQSTTPTKTAPLEQSENESTNAGVIAKTRAEAAQLLGVDERTISKWMADPTFPGKSGTAGQRNGHFPIDAIKRWRGVGQCTSGEHDEDDLLRRRKLAAEVLTRELKVAKEEGRLIPLEDQISVVVSAVSSMRAILEEIPEWLAAEYPVDRPASRRRARRVGKRVIARALAALDDALRADPDEAADDNGEAAINDGLAQQLDPRQDGPAKSRMAATSQAKTARSDARRGRGGTKAKA